MSVSQESVAKRPVSKRAKKGGAPDSSAVRALSPRSFSPFGLEAAQDTLRHALAEERFAHAWLFQGPRGIGKATLAFWTARLLLGGEAAASRPDHPIALAVAARAHPDLWQLTSDQGGAKKGNEITVDAVRRLNSRMRMTAGRAGWRVAIVDSACALNRQAANALLKLVEEPPARVAFLMTCHRRGGVPITLASRCRRLTLPLPDWETFQAILRDRVLGAGSEDKRSQSDLAALYLLSQGAPGAALEIGRLGGVELYRMLLDILTTDEPDGALALAHDFASRLERDGDDDSWRVFVLLLESILRHALYGRIGALGASPGRDPGSDALAPLLRMEASLFASVSPRTILSLLEKIEEDLRKVESMHLSRAQAAVVALESVLRVRQGIGVEA